LQLRGWDLILANYLAQNANYRIAAAPLIALIDPGAVGKETIISGSGRRGRGKIDGVIYLTRKSIQRVDGQPLCAGKRDEPPVEIPGLRAGQLEAVEFIVTESGARMRHQSKFCPGLRLDYRL
jgi:hypothetical protein